jgi:hypothetical protein
MISIDSPLPFIWRSAKNEPTPNTWTYFKKTFRWDTSQSTKILFSADPTARLWVNGRVVLTRVMRFVSPQITTEEIDLAEYLHQGGNSIVVLHHWWGVRTFQRSRGGAAGIAIHGDFLKTDSTWLWRNADEFLNHSHQTIGGNAQRIRFPVIMDARLMDPDQAKWIKAVDGKWGQCANLDRVQLCPIFAACHGACVSNFPAPFTT